MKKIFIILSMMFVPVVSLAAQGKAIIQSTEPGSKISGEVTFTEQNGGVLVEAKVVNVSPGKHGFHVHENGSCAEMGKAAGKHFNPDNVCHGLLPKDGFQKAQAGDMGNIEVGADGTGTFKLFMPGLTLKDGKYAVAGKSVILHAKEDDFTQPVGNAGARIGCGIIEIKDERK